MSLTWFGPIILFVPLPSCSRRRLLSLTFVFSSLIESPCAEQSSKNKEEEMDGYQKRRKSAEAGSMRGLNCRCRAFGVGATALEEGDDASDLIWVGVGLG
ncbi:hypothetical protein PIB30_000465 [Stylosanthes scabra]|uniref:Secreted protein n=1 Tax=Stylosanthes scabra TaxID=79078 RepID=A0ABU6V1Q3_9FABA|nr:hypothetical protein [Stylosanthes scabra]